MTDAPLDIVFLGLSITSSWGNGHATTYRGLVRELNKKWHRITFLERDMPWYASQRDLVQPPFCTTILYKSISELRERYAGIIANAHLVIVGSYVPEGVAAGDLVIASAKGVTAFYDIDTPVTLAKIEKNDFEYLHPRQIPGYNMYLSFTGGPVLKKLENIFNSPMAKPFYCSFDADLYYPDNEEIKWDLGYLGTYSTDRQPPLQKLMLDAASNLKEANFVIAGPLYPGTINWPANVERIEHLAPLQHRKFYNSQRFTMNITRADMVKAGYSPSVRLFEAAACGTPVISDYREGIDSFFDPGSEILISSCAQDTQYFITRINENERKNIGELARKKVMKYHTAAHRATELIGYYQQSKIKKDTSLPALNS